MLRKRNKLNMMCPISSDILGVTSINLIKSLKDKLDISLFPIPIADKLSFNSKEDYDLCIGAIRYSRNFLYNAPTLKIWHTHDLAIKPGNGSYYIFVIPKSDYLDQSEIHNINFADGIFVHSEYAKNIMHKHKIKKPIYVLSLGVDRDVFQLNKENREDSSSYVFYVTGRWSMSNGQDFAIKAFDEAFTDTDNVELRLLPYNEFLKEDEENYWFSIIEKCRLKNKITVYNKLDSQHDLCSFISNSDCLLSLNRIATNGINIIEAMAMNKPVICTNTGIHKEYIDGGLNYISISDTETASDKRIFFGETSWAKLGDAELKQTVDIMRNLYQSNTRTNEQGLVYSQKYNWANTADSIYNIIFSNKKRTLKNRI